MPFRHTTSPSLNPGGLAERTSSLERAMTALEDLLRATSKVSR